MIPPKYDESISRILSEIDLLVKEMPRGKALQVQNRTSKIKVILSKKKRTQKNMEHFNDNQSKEVYRFNARKAILEALFAGRHLSQMDCKEFMVEDMRTPISHMKGRFEKTHNLHTKWITTPVRKARIKEYWLEPKETN